MIEVVIDSHLRADGNNLGVDVVEEIFDELTIPNSAKEEAKRMNRYGWQDMEDDSCQAELDGDTLVMPRGYAHQLKLLLREHGSRIKWIDKRRWRYGAPYGNDEFSYRPHQPKAVRSIRRHQQGIYKAPTGSGKTVTVCGVLWETCPDSALILTDRVNMVSQWMRQILQHIGNDVKVGLIGQGKWQPNRITVATIQTLYTKRNEQRVKDFLSRQSFVCLDEMHHVTADMYRTIIDPCPARLRFGVSATPDKTGDFLFALNTLGEIFYETTDQELREAGLLLQPHVEVVHTAFTFPYYGDHKADKQGRCEKPGCKLKTAYHGHRNNYAKCKAALVADRQRNDLIARRINKHAGHVQIAITNEIKQISEINSAITRLKDEYKWNAGKVYILTGKQTGKQRDSIIEEIESAEEPCVILSTIAGEGFDVPIIDRVHLPFPTNNPGTTKQNIGRGTRLVEGKGDFVVIDYADSEVKVFGKQLRTRRWKAYEPLGLKVTINDG